MEFEKIQTGALDYLKIQTGALNYLNDMITFYYLPKEKLLSDDGYTFCKLPHTQGYVASIK